MCPAFVAIILRRRSGSCATAATASSRGQNTPNSVPAPAASPSEVGPRGQMGGATQWRRRREAARGGGPKDPGAKSCRVFHCSAGGNSPAPANPPRTSGAHILGAGFARCSRCSASSRVTTAFSDWKPPCCISSHSSAGSRSLYSAGHTTHHATTIKEGRGFVDRLGEQQSRRSEGRGAHPHGRASPVPRRRRRC